MNAGWLWDAAILTRFHLDPRARTPIPLLPRRQHPCPASHHVRRAGRRMDGRVDEAPQLQENTMSKPTMQKPVKDQVEELERMFAE